MVFRGTHQGHVRSDRQAQLLLKCRLALRLRTNPDVVIWVKIYRACIGFWHLRRHISIYETIIPFGRPTVTC